MASNPPSPYWEEVALGYDAYSLLKTGHDHRGNSWPIVYINSYMDYKPPLYVYITIPSVAVFGLNEFGVRFPSAFFGTLTVLVIYFLTKELFQNFTSEVRRRRNTTSEVFLNPQLLNYSIANYLPITAMLLLAISPWHLQFSRAAFEANLALFLITTGILFFIKSFKRPLYLFFSVLVFCLSLYTYHGARVFTPLICLLLTIIYFKELFRRKKVLILAFIFGIFLILPIINAYFSKEVQQRFQETSAFTTLAPIIESNTKIEKDGGTIIARLTHHRFWEYARIFLTNYSTYFSGSYLFLSGDGNPRHSTQEFGELYHWEIITLIIGLVYLIKNIKQKSSLLILGWLLISFVPGAITVTNPHAIRTIFGLPAFIIISSVGLIWLIKYCNNKKIILITVYCLLFTELILYLHFYYHHYPKLYSDQWQYGYKEAISYLKENEAKYDYIYLTDKYGRAYMYYLFFSQSDPSEIQKLIILFKNNPNVDYLGKVYFSGSDKFNGSQLLITEPGEISEGRLIKSINFLDGKPAFKIWEKKNKK